MFRLHFHCHPPPKIHRAQNHYNNLNLFLVNHILWNPNHLYRCLNIDIDYFFLVHKSWVRISLVHMFLCKIFFILTKRVREPNFCEPNFCEPTFCELNFCEPSSHIFSVNFELWFTFFLSSQISSEPVNHGSQITPAPTSLLKL